MGGVILSFGLSVAASAQAIAGTVFLPDRTTILSGVIVVATDDQGATSRGLSSETGHFAVRLPHTGRYSLRLLRIGFRPTIGPTIDVGSGVTQNLVLVAQAEPISLSAITVRSGEVCRVRPDSGLLVAQVWEEARKAMTASQLAQEEARPFAAAWIEYDRLLDSSGRRIRRQSVRGTTQPTTHAFKSLPASVFAAKGYVFEDSGSTKFFAPDPEVLLSDQFAATHCFRLVRTTETSTPRLGVAFEPTRERGSMRDIEGTVWVDQGTTELRSLEFRYTNLPEAAEAAAAGGRVAFRRTPGGQWFVYEWELRFPILAKAGAGRAAGTRQLSYSATKLEVTGIQVNGGELTELRRGDSTFYSSTRPSLMIQLVRQDSLVSLAGADVSIDGTSIATTTDSAGLVRIGGLLRGDYLARIQLPVLELLDQPPLEHDVRIATGTAIDSLILPTSAEILARVCPKDAVRKGEGMLYGVVKDDRGYPAAAATVTATWRRIAGTERSAAAPSITEQSSTTSADNRGRWHLCGTPRGVDLVVRTSAGSGSATQRARIPQQLALQPVALLTQRAVVSRTDADARATVEFFVTNPSGAALPGVSLNLRDDQGTAHQLTTGTDGRAIVSGLRAGQVSVESKRIGFKAGTISLAIAEGTNTVPIILSEVSTPQLDTMRVVAIRDLAGRHSAFEARRARQDATATFTRADIENRNPVDAWQMLTNVPSVKVIQTGSKVTIESARGFVFERGKLVPCYFAVMVDGILLNANGTDVNLNQLPRPDEIYGIEVFAGAARIPPEYAVNGRCGLVAIWTR